MGSKLAITSVETDHELL